MNRLINFRSCARNIDDGTFFLCRRLAQTDTSMTLKSREHQKFSRMAEVDPEAEFSPDHSPAAKAVARANRVHLTLSHKPGVPLGEVEVERLVNGMLVASVPTEFPAYHVQLAVKAGPRYEEPWSSGASHVTRRMLGLASKPFRFAVNQNRTLQQVGANVEFRGLRELNAYSMSHYKFRDEAVDIAATAFAFASTQPAFYPWEIKRNAELIRSDLAHIRGSTAFLAERFHSVAYKTGLANSLFCPEHRVGEVNADVLEEYFAQFYTPDRFALVGVGLPMATMKDLAHKLCYLEPKQLPQAPASQWRGGECRYDNGNPTVQMLIGVEGRPLGSADSAAQTVLTALLCGGPGLLWDSGRLSPIGAAAASAVKSSAPCAVSGVNLQYSDSGVLGFHIICGYEDAGSVAKAVAGAFRQLARSGVAEADVNSAKAVAGRLAAEAKLQPQDRLTELANRLLHSQPGPDGIPVVDDATDESAIAKVTAEQVNQLLKSLLKSSPAMASMGRLDTVPFKDELF
ncbi:hypothetical protein BOX15_Mlig005061g1 [Macrostomum lignano]|uniref:Peptidase M16 inactive domain protein n=2 Tax=Macrostomum lignano TaxID=282301 RepID=A0A1I8J1B0_9PLAT|nr:hypothetical protein BOX15_Mlig005061g2 [Macrostomum lignano]PAA90873.1 hypothetical protein BOX15_Mlig005061g1 [Macrostomum lignano]